MFDIAERLLYPTRLSGSDTSGVPSVCVGAISCYRLRQYVEGQRLPARLQSRDTSLQKGGYLIRDGSTLVHGGRSGIVSTGDVNAP
jgi:hypothetical protein